MMRKDGADFFDTDGVNAYYPDPMSTDQIIAAVNPRKMAEMNRILKGTISLGALPRVVDALVSPSLKTPVEIALVFQRNTEGLFMIVGHLSTEVPMRCQRCLGTVNVPIEAKVNVVLVWHDEQAQTLKNDWDTLVVADELSVKALIEDELLLNFPLAPSHEDAHCLPYHGTTPMDPAVEAPVIPNAFGVLVKLKAGKRENPEKT